MTRSRTTCKQKRPNAVAVFHGPTVQGHVVATPSKGTTGKGTTGKGTTGKGTTGKGGIDLVATFHKLPAGLHGFHIHKAGDMRQKDCMGLCEHYDKGRHRHGAGPGSRKSRHTGDLGNIRGRRTTVRRRYNLPGVSVKDLWGRSVIVHKDKDDLGHGHHPDSGTTGHSGARMAAAVFGRGFSG